MTNASKQELGPVRKLWHRTRKLLLWSSLAAAVLVIGYLVFAIVLGLMPVNAGHKQPERGIEIFVHSNGVHTDFILPVRTPARSWPSFVPLVDDPATSASATFVGFGWGDRQLFLTTRRWRDLTVKTALNAAFLPSATAIHVTYWERPPKESDKCRRLVLTRQQHDELVEYITNSLVLDEHGKPKQIPGSGYKYNDTFYEAKGSYNLFFTCNEWTNRGLARIGVRAARWSPFDTAIFYQLKQIK